MRARYFILILALLFCVPVYPEAIKLKNGRVISGKIVKRTDKFIKINIKDIIITLYFEDILSIDGKPLLKDLHSSEDKETVSSQSIDKQLNVKIFSEEWNVPEGIREIIYAGVEKLQKIYNDIFDLHFAEDFVVKIRIFRDIDDFFDYQSKVSTTHSGYGFYSSGEAVTYLYKDTSRMMSLVLHETNHALFHSLIFYQPVSINEGISEYFENMKVEEGFAFVLPNDKWSINLRQRLRWDSIMSLEKFLKMSKQQWHSYDSLPDSPGRMISWSIIFFLMETVEGRETLKNVLHYLAKPGNKVKSLVTAFDIHYPGGLSQLEKDWHDWIPKEKLMHVYDFRFEDISHKLLNPQGNNDFK